jgi:hypothetical protein
MPQLVGLECALCHAPIASVLDGEFCATCGNPVHKRCATPRVAKSGACEVCGADATAGAAHRQRSQEEATAHARRVWRYNMLAGLFFLGWGLACLAYGAVWLVVSVAQDEMYGRWIGATIVGAALTVRGLTHFRRLWRARRSDDER